MSFLDTVRDPMSVITPIEHGVMFPEKVCAMLSKYKGDIKRFQELVRHSSSSADLLALIRDSSMDSAERMSLLKLFRRCVSLVCDTEMTKKVRTISTATIVANLGHTFKGIDLLKRQFDSLTEGELSALAVSLGEYDDRGQLGYRLTGLFFGWFEEKFPDIPIAGPRGAGRDIELSSVFPDFRGSYPCDFVLRDQAGHVLAIGFARYDSTRGGAQSDDRTGGNLSKVLKAQEYAERTHRRFRIVFLADGPGMAHRDTWEESCRLDDSWDGNVRVTTLCLAELRVTRDWLAGVL